MEHIGQAIALFRTLGDSQSLISSLAMRAIQSMPGSSITTLCPLRTRDECVQDAEEALRLARQIDSLLGQAFAEAALAHTLLSFGEFGPALSHAQEALRIASEIEHRQWMVSSYFALGNIYLLLLGPDTEALTALQAGLSLARELGSTFWIVTLVADLGRAYLLNHNLPQAQATLQAVMPREQHPRTMAERHIALACGPSIAYWDEPTCFSKGKSKPGRNLLRRGSSLRKLRQPSMMRLCANSFCIPHLVRCQRKNRCSRGRLPSKPLAV